MAQNLTQKLTKGASRAAILGDGRVARRSRNYESTFDGRLSSTKTHYKSLPMPSGSLNSQSNPYGSSTRDRILKYSFYITLISIIATASYIYYNKKFNTNFSAGVTGILQNVSVENSTRELELERIANLIIQDSDWNVNLTESFVEKWEELTKSERQKIYYTAWYQHFSFLLESMYKEHKKADSFKLDSNNEYQDPLLTLALTVGVAEQIKNNDINPVSRRNTNKLVPGVTNAKPKTKKELVPSKIALIQSSIRSSLPTSRYDEAAPSITPEIIIREEEVDDIIAQYKVAYNQGSIAGISELFDTKNNYENDNFLNQLSTSYAEVFENTSARNVDFTNLIWEYRDNKAFGSGEYSATIKLINGGGTQYVDAKVEMELQLFQGDLRFASLQLIDSEIAVSKAAATLSRSTNLSTRRQISAAPTRAELQDVLARFVNAYESGDANLFDALFSSDVQTNDHNDLQGIKEDYSKVFSNTSDRQMFIQNINWTVEGDNAKGIGQLDAIVLPKDKGETQVIKGQIKLVVKKSNDKLMITHFFHTSY